MKLVFTFIIFFLLTTSISWGQTPITTVDNSTISTNTGAAEGDYYVGEAPIYQIYIGLANGEYLPVYAKNLAQILNINNSANNLNIINVVDPTADQDAATKNYVDNNLSKTIYTADGTLSTSRTLDGADKDLTETDILTYNVNAAEISLNSSQAIDVTGTTGINLTTSYIDKSVAVSGNFIDSNGSSGIDGQVLKSNGNNTAWVTSSAISNNIRLYSAQSPSPFTSTTAGTHQEWQATAEDGRTKISVIDFEVTKESIVTVNYNFRYYKFSFGANGMRKVFLAFRDLSILVTDTVDNITEDFALSTATTPLTGYDAVAPYPFKGVNKASHDYLYTTPGLYRVELITTGDFKIGTGTNTPGVENYHFTGFTFDVCVTPKIF